MKYKGVTQETAENILNEYSSLPLGTVLDWWRPNTGFTLPIEYHYCDGSPIIESTSPYIGWNSPNLLEKFVLSANTISQIGDVGGTDSVDLEHGHVSSTHSHNFSHSHWFTIGWSTVNSGVSDTQFPGGDLVARHPHTHGDINIVQNATTENSAPDINLTSIISNNIPPYLGILKILKVNTELKSKINNTIKVNGALDSLSGLLLGSIINWWVPDKDSPYIPIGYVRCDGNLISDTTSPFNGLNSPNLIDKFLRGVPVNRIGEYSGDNTQNYSHQHIISDHIHGAAHGAATVLSDIAIQAGDDDVHGSGSLVVYLSHHHQIFIPIGLMNTWGIGSDPKTSFEGSTYPNIPSYYNLVKLVKIK
jgi:hypothetical protein